jgi:ribosomal protein L11 methyltransferase
MRELVMMESEQSKNKNLWFEIHVPVTEAAKEAVSNFLFEMGCTGCEEKPEKIVAYFPDIIPPLTILSKVKNYLADLAQLGFKISPDAVYVKETLLRDWQSEWKKHFTPIKITNTLYVKPTWYDFVSPPKSIVLEIDPGMAFGTGHHASTYLLLKLLEKYCATGDSVLDVGTGTGILSIAAKKLGAASVFAFDNDSTVVLTAKKNAAASKTEGSIHIWAGTVESIRGGKFDLIMANIIASKLLPIIPALYERLKTSGILLLSGLLQDEEHSFYSLFKDCGVSVQTKIRKNGWTAFAVKLVK